ncbi:MAG: hypothetical protein JXB38_05740 [Anaerolineales bacterium]|nr:hypothetical protein [Anaerolineales bacterium]
MKARPRDVENRVAEEFSKIFARYGLEPVERIPVLGRTGPDISINEAGFVIDVKSRLQCPKTYIYQDWQKHGIIKAGGVLLCPIKFFDEFVLQGEREPTPIDFVSKMVAEWWCHMHGWTRDNCPDNYSMIVLHKPRLPIGNSIVVFLPYDRRPIHEQFANFRK